MDNSKKGSIDKILLIVTAGLTLIGIIMQYSASSYDLSVAGKQLVFALLGFLIAFIVRIFPMRVLNVLAKISYILAMLATIVTGLIGKEVKGARRWIQLGPITFQPSEILKVAVILAVAALICKYINVFNESAQYNLSELLKNRKDRDFKEKLKTYLPYILVFILSLAAAGIVAVFNKDMGTAIIVFLIGFIMLMVVSPKTAVPFVLLAIVAALGVVLIFSQGYRMGRIEAWLHPSENTGDLGFQIKQGLYAIGSGGWFGRGLGNSIQKEVIPEPHTDMIFTIVCEEMGVIGGIIIIVLFVILILRLLKIFSQTRELFGRLIVAGVAAHIGMQTIINLAVMCNLIPNTGVPLPFISYGGTSLLCLWTEIGMVMAVKRSETIQNILYHPDAVRES